MQKGAQAAPFWGRTGRRGGPVFGAGIRPQKWTRPFGGSYELILGRRNPDPKMVPNSGPRNGSAFRPKNEPGHRPQGRLRNALGYPWGCASEFISTTSVFSIFALVFCAFPANSSTFPALAFSLHALSAPPVQFGCSPCSFSSLAAYHACSLPCLPTLFFASVASQPRIRIGVSSPWDKPCAEQHSDATVPPPKRKPSCGSENDPPNTPNNYPWRRHAFFALSPILLLECRFQFSI